jgi:uncharacterized protein YeaO (DUF488 family)
MIYTSYYAHYKGSNGISISCGIPKGLIVLRCKELEPPWDLVNDYKTGKITKKQYRNKYIRQLKALYVNKFAKILEGKVLLCYEKPEDFCHRSIVREWINHYGYICMELDEIHTIEPLVREDLCITCKSLKTHSCESLKSSKICSKTGEIIANDRVQGCSDWRYKY